MEQCAIQSMGHMKDKTNTFIETVTYSGFISHMVAKTIPDFLSRKLPEGTTNVELANTIASIVDKILTEQEFMDSAVKSKVYSAVYIAGYLQGVKTEAKRLVAEAKDVRSIEDVVMSIQELMSSKNISDISKALENKLKKELIDDNVRYQKERADETDMVSKIDNTVGDRVVSTSPTNTSLSKSADDIFDDTDDLSMDGPEDKYADDTPDNTNEEGDTTEEDEDLMSETTRMMLLDNKRAYYTEIYDVMKQWACGPSDSSCNSSSNTAKVAIVGVLGLANFLDQVDVLPIDVFVVRLKSAIGYKEPARTQEAGMGLDVM
ncbi:MAG: hypothetical protein ACRCZ9_12430 [Fusobacteriaceae bacterium]